MVDEARLKRDSRRAGDSAIECAVALAAAKAIAVSQRDPEALVIGADQILVMGAEWFDKPVDSVEAATQLRRLRGNTHVLATAVCASVGGRGYGMRQVHPK